MSLFRASWLVSVLGLLACTAPDPLSESGDGDEADLVLSDPHEAQLAAEPWPTAATLPPSFVGDFESGALRWSYPNEAWSTSGAQWDFLRGAPPSSARPAGAQVSVTSNSAIVRQGRLAGRFILRPGDIADPGRTTNERLEVRSSLAQAGAVEGEEAWYGWSTYFPSDFRTRKANLSPGNAIFTDFKPHGPIVNACIGNEDYGFLTPTAVFRVYAEPDTSGRGPRIDLTIAGGTLTPIDPARHECTRPSVHTFTLVEPFVAGRWYDFVVRVKWSPDPQVGFVEVWVDGALALPRFAAATLYGGATAYLKQGLYRAASPDVSWLVIDGTRRGRSYAEVAP